MGDTQVVVVELEHIRDLRKGFAQMWLVPVTGVVVEVGMGNIFIMSCSPLGILSIFLSTNLQPFLLSSQRLCLTAH
jgi:hypothetical protein